MEEEDGAAPYDASASLTRPSGSVMKRDSTRGALLRYALHPKVGML
jgi:hypothetical protein